MNCYELRLWRRGMGWTQERAAEELDVSLRTYKRYERDPGQRLPAIIEYATRFLTLRQMLPDLQPLSRDGILTRIENVLVPPDTD